MSGDSMRAKARQIFGKEFMNAVKPQAPAKNEAVALQKRANARPIPTYKDGGKIAGMPPQKRGPNGSVTVAIGVEMKPKKPGYRTMTEAEQKASEKRAMRASEVEAGDQPLIRRAQGGKVLEDRLAARLAAGNYKKGGKVQTSSDTARKLATEMGGMCKGGKMKKMAVGGAGKVRKGQAPIRKAEGGAVERRDRKMADIEKDYRKALDAGRNADVAKAKYEQRMADARDDFAKWTKADRSETKAAEAAAEKNLTLTRMGGAKKAVSEAITKAPEIKADKVQDLSGMVRALTTSAESTGTVAPKKAAAPSLPSRKAVKTAAPAAKAETRGPDIVVTASKKKAAAPTAEKRDYSGPAMRERFAGGIGSVVKAPFKVIARGIDRVLAPGEAAPEAPAPSRNTRLEKLRMAAEAPGASMLAKDRYRAAKESGMYANGGAVGKYAQGGAGKVRKGMMTPHGEITPGTKRR